MDSITAPDSRRCSDSQIVADASEIRKKTDYAQIENSTLCLWSAILLATALIVTGWVAFKVRVFLHVGINEKCDRKFDFI